MMEQLLAERPAEDILMDVTAAVPQLVDSFTPDNAADQKMAFLADDTMVAPNHEYGRLQQQDFAANDEHLAALGLELKQHHAISEKQRPVYAAYITRRRQTNRLLHCAAIIQSDADPEQKAAAEAEYTALNTEIYGEVDQATYNSIVAAKVYAIEIDPADTAAVDMHAELMAMLPQEVLQTADAPYAPSAKAFATMQHVVSELYEGLLERIPDRETKYTSEDIQAIVGDIITKDFAESAEGWHIVVSKKKGLGVNPARKEVRISETITKDAASLRGLLVHELGVHMLRAVRGSETDLLPMELGLEGYYDAEEGMGMVMQQAVEGTFSLPGAGHYITAGYMAAGKSFRETFEMKWRLQVLQDAGPGKPVTAENIEKARSDAYGQVLRIARGTDSLALHKDLAYYNGAKSMWQYFEQYAGDEDMLNLALLGKLDPSQQPHRYAALETRSVK